jgi:hypothetical protein
VLPGCGGGGGGGGNGGSPAGSVQTKTLELQSFEQEPVEVQYGLLTTKSIPVTTSKIEEPVEFTLLTKKEGLTLEENTGQITWRPPENKDETIQVTLKAEAGGLSDKQVYSFKTLKSKKVDQKRIKSSGSQTVTFRSEEDTHYRGVRLVVPEGVDRGATTTVSLYTMPQNASSSSGEDNIFPQTILKTNIPLIGDTSSNFYFDIPLENLEYSSIKRDSDQIFMVQEQTAGSYNGTSQATQKNLTLHRPTTIKDGNYLRTSFSASASSNGSNNFSFDILSDCGVHKSEHFILFNADTSPLTTKECLNLPVTLDRASQFLENSYDVLDDKFTMPSDSIQVSFESFRDTLGYVGHCKPSIIHISKYTLENDVPNVLSHELTHVAQNYSLGIESFFASSNKRHGCGITLFNTFLFEGVAVYYENKIDNEEFTVHENYTDRPLWGDSATINGSPDLYGDPGHPYHSVPFFKYLEQNHGFTPSAENYFSQSQRGALRRKNFTFKRIHTLLKNSLVPESFSEVFHNFSLQYNVYQNDLWLPGVNDWGLNQPTQINDPLIQGTENHNAIFEKGDERLTLVDSITPLYTSKVFKISQNDTSEKAITATSTFNPDIKISLFNKGELQPPPALEFTFQEGTGSRKIPTTISDTFFMVATFLPGRSLSNLQWHHLAKTRSDIRIVKKGNDPEILYPTGSIAVDTNQIRLFGNLGNDTHVSSVTALQGTGDSTSLRFDQEADTFSGRLDIVPGTNTILVQETQRSLIGSDTVTFFNKFKPLEISEAESSKNFKNVGDTKQNLVMMQLELDNTLESDTSVRIDELKFGTKGSISKHSPFVDEAKIYEDSNNNGTYEAGTDTFIASGSFRDTALVFELNEAIPADKNKAILITYSFNGNPRVGDKFQLKLSETTTNEATYRETEFSPELFLSPIKGPEVKISGENISGLIDDSVHYWKQFGKNRRNSAVTSGQGQLTDVSLKWKFNTLESITTPAPIEYSPVAGDIDGDSFGEIVVASNKNIFVLEADGSQKWKYVTGDESTVTSPPVLGNIDSDDELEVMIGSETRLIVLNSDGTRKWTKSITEAKPTLGDIDNNNKKEIVVASKNNKVHAFNGDGTKRWTEDTLNSITVVPALGDLDRDDKLETVVGNYDNLVYVIDEDGTFKWHYSTNGSAINSSPALGDIDNDNFLEVVVGDAGGQVHAIDHTGSKQWSESTSLLGVESSPALGDVDSDGRLEVVVGDSNGNLHIFDKNDGRDWMKSTGGPIVSSPSLGNIDNDSDLEIVVGSNDNKIYAFNPFGKKLWDYETKDIVTASPALADVDGGGSLEVLVGSWDFRLYVLEEK